MKSYRTIVLWLLIFSSPSFVSAAEIDFMQTLIESTFKIQGENSSGTCFIIGKTNKPGAIIGDLEKPVQADATRIYYVLVTAAHVLEGMTGEVVLHLRKKQGDGYVKMLHPVPIRHRGRSLWVRHPDADVAAMYVNVPEGILSQVLLESFLVTDEILQWSEISPGDRLFALGYPFGAEANDAGFPILRGGYIASYPILPTKKVKTFLFDFEIRRGNSGGPVIFSDYNRTLLKGKGRGRFNFIVGLVSEQTIIYENIDTLYQSRREKHPINLATVIHASIIQETVDLLP